jgi:CBS domain containing-hemolysin-like protein
MKIQEILAQSIDSYIENNILEDIVRDDDLVEKILEKIRTTNSPADFLVVNVDGKNVVRGVLTYREIGQFLATIGEEAKKNSALKISETEFSKAFPAKYSVHRSTLAITVLNMFRQSPTDIIIVTNDGGNVYVGKIKRGNFISKINAKLQG